MAMAHRSEIRDGLRAIYVRSQKTLDKILAPYGSSSARYSLMAYIAKNDGVRSADIIKAFALAPRTVTEAIDVLESEGLVERRADTVDRRAKVLALTPAGTKLLCKLEPIWDGFGQRLLSALPAEERKQFGNILGKLVKRLDELHAETENSTALEKV
jgi:DNA-binding MarR family transcriptional regulator